MDKYNGFSMLCNFRTASRLRGHALADILSPMETLHRKQCKRYDIDGQAHCLTFSCFQRQPFFSQDRCCEWLIQGMQKGRENGMYDLYSLGQDNMEGGEGDAADIVSW